MNSDGGNSIEFTLPAMPYKMQDGMERTNCGDPAKLRYEVTGYEKDEYLARFIGCTAEGEEIQKLNLLSLRLGELDEYQKIAFQGMTEKFQSMGEISLERLVDMSYSTESCHVLPEVRSDFQLGEFCVDNGLIAALEDIPEEVKKYLDYEKIGREHREDEGGIITEKGYVEQWDDIHRMSEGIDFQYNKPEYTILLETQGEYLALPMPEAELEKYTWGEEREYRCADCAVPFLAESINEIGDAEEINRFAGMLEELTEQGQLQTFKAVLQATECRNIEQAQELGEDIEETYVLFKEAADPIEVAREWLCEQYAEDIELFSDEDLWHIGQRYIEKYPTYQTDYGYLQRYDFKPIEPLEENLESTIEPTF